MKRSERMLQMLGIEVKTKRRKTTDSDKSREISTCETLEKTNNKRIQDWLDAMGLPPPGLPQPPSCSGEEEPTAETFALYDMDMNPPYNEAETLTVLQPCPPDSYAEILTPADAEAEADEARIEGSKIRRRLDFQDVLAADTTKTCSTQEKKKRPNKGTRMKKMKRQTQRNSGEEYETAKGCPVRRRVMTRLTNCRMKCDTKIDEKTQGEIFKKYWSLGSRNKRASFVTSKMKVKIPEAKKKNSNCCTPEKKNRTVTYLHFLPTPHGDVRVCKRCFLSVLGETNKFLWVAGQKMKFSPLNYDSPDKRGKNTPAHKLTLFKLQEVREFLAKLPVYESHYCRKDTSKLYLPPFVTLRKTYDMYCKSVSEPVSIGLYSRYFRKANIKIKEPNKDTCKRCDELSVKLKHCPTDEKASLVEEQKKHHEDAELAYSSKRMDKEKAKTDPQTTCMAFDLQQCLPTPQLETSLAFYKRQLWTFNLTVHNMKNDEATCFIWDESQAKRGANEIASCVSMALNDLPPGIRHVILYSDCCPGQNKNSIFMAMCLWLLQKNNNIETIDHKFMVSGHSRMECDSDHGVIEKAKKRYEHSIIVPHDWAILIASASKKRPFRVKELVQSDILDYAALLKTHVTVKSKEFKIQTCKWLRYRRGHSKVLFKNSLREDEEFSEINASKRGQCISDASLKKAYSGPLPITKEKKKDLLSLMPFIPPFFRQFYQDLKTADHATDPYVDESIA